MTEFTRIREQLLADQFPQWNAYTWGKTYLLRLMDRRFVERVNQDSAHLVGNLCAVGFDAFELRSIVAVTKAAAGDIYVEVRYVAVVRFTGRVARKDERSARALRWQPSRPFEVGALRTVFRGSEMPLDVLVILSPAGRFKSADLRDFGYGRGTIGRPRYSHLESDD